ncbi:hypothetical protein [Pontibacter litorisediminis]|uniref:hypothetical protein n=1 Tax=Pontibacter litorisediminis TaxID=1846260 RepID=UPI0023EBBB8C|nr:hypothetical protein [Pontibacter litorisediminis]
MNDLMEFTLGYYETRIKQEFAIDDVGITLDRLGGKSFEKVIPVDLNNPDLLNQQELEVEIPEVIKFIRKVLQKNYSYRPVWFKTNVVDQAVNDYVGIGLLNLGGPWLKFIICSLSFDRAAQSGDTLMTVFDTGFQWAINFELSQDNSCLTVQKIEK